mgnify:CR=1 FL=1
MKSGSLATYCVLFLMVYGLFALMFYPSTAVLALAEAVGGQEFLVKPVAVVYSPLDYEVDPASTHYGLLTAQYFLMLAGIPYEIVFDHALDADSLDNYSCLLFPYHRWVDVDAMKKLAKVLPKWIEEGGSAIIMGVPDEIVNGTPEAMQDWLQLYQEIFKVEYGGWRDVNGYTIVIAENHPITRDHPPGYAYPIPKGKAYDYFIATSPEVHVLLRSGTGDVLAVCTEYGAGRAVLFSLFAFNEFFQWTKILLRAIQWAVYGDRLPVGVQLTAGRVAWMLNIDADWSADTSATGKALHILLEKSEEEAFPFSWAIITGLYSGFDTPIEWRALKTLFEAAEEAGVEMTSHTVHHPVWAGVDAEQARFEVIESKKHIEGNLSEIWGFQVPDGMYPLEYYPYIVEAGYRYFIQTFAAPYLHMAGIQPLTDSTSVFVIWRATYSDYYYFDYANYTSEDAIRQEKENFEKFYDLGHSAPYALLWHDYSMVDEERLAVFLQVLEYEYLSRPDVFPLTPKEFLLRFEAWSKLRFSVIYEGNSLKIRLDTSRLGEEELPYISAMGLYLDGDVKIGSVYLQGEYYPLFSSRRVIIPSLSRGVHEFEIVFGEPIKLHITHITSCRILSWEVDQDEIRLNISRLGDNRVRLFLTAGGKLLVNGEQVKLEEFSSELEAASVVLERVEIPLLPIEIAPPWFSGTLFTGLLIAEAISTAFLVAVLRRLGSS